jgi:iron complex outermembrane receptor protein
MVGALAGNFAARAQTATPVVVPDSSTAPLPVIVPGQGTPQDLSAYQIQEVKILYKKLILREKDIPNAVSVLGSKAVEAENPTTGSIQTLLNKTPSVVAYTQQPGQDAATLAIRGVRNDELSETLDGVPINNLLNGSGDYVSSAWVGSPVTLNEIDGVTVYPGLAPPDHQGFSTAGGTIAYTTKQPTDERYAELEGGFGSFDTQHFGFTINTGDIGSGPDAAKALILYDQSQTAGYVSNTPAQFHNFMLNVEKPYDNGLSKLGLVIIFNQGKALVQTEPTPTALLQQYGYKYNFPTSLGFYNQADQYLTVIASDETYINQYLIFNGSLFYSHTHNTVDDYESVAGDNYPYTVNVQGIGTFFGPIGPSAVANFGAHVGPPSFNYDPLIFNPGADPTVASSYYPGETDEFVTAHSNTIGITPKLNIFAGPNNTVTIGGLLAKQSSGGDQFVYGGDGAQGVQEVGYNSLDIGPGEQRTIFDAYIQDKISLFGGKLQIVPGVKVDAAYSSVNQITSPESVYSPAKLTNFTKIGEYYLGAAYNLPDNFILFGSLGKGSLFAPVDNYGVGLNTGGISGPGTTAPTPEIVHLFEGGIRYDTPRLYLSLDYYYQAIADGFAFFEDFVTGASFYANNGGYLFRGLEGSGEYRITPNLSIYGNGSYNKTEYTKSFFGFDTLAEDQFGYAFTGTPLSNVPDWDANIGIDYDDGPFSARLSGQYTGREFITDDLEAQPYGSAAGPGGNPPAVAPNPLNGATVTDTKIENPANFLVNLFLSYKIPLEYSHLQSLTVDLNMQNIFNEHYYTYEYSADNPLNGFYSYLPPFTAAFEGEPRSFTVDLVARF